LLKVIKILYQLLHIANLNSCVRIGRYKWYDL